MRAGSGQVGKIILVSRLSAFVELYDGGAKHTTTFLLSELAKIDPPQEPPVGAAH